MNEITINGLTYRKRQQSKNSRNISMAMHILGTSVQQMFGSGNKQQPPQVNIISEFELIQQKKSNLSKSQRDWVVREFNKRFELIDNNNE